jgi:glycosyltransferase involved in cell wall biosynthesis
MKLVYIFNNRLESGIANRIQTLHVAFAFDKILGQRFRFISGDGYSKQELIKFGYRKSLSNHIQLSLPNIKHGKTIFFVLILIIRRFIAREDILYCRDYPVVVMLTYLKRAFGIKNKIFFEMHEIPDNNTVAKSIQFVDGIITISETIQQDLKRLKIKKPCCVAHDGFKKNSLYLSDISNSEVDEIIDSIDNKTVVYVGSSSKWKNIEFISELASLKKNLKFVLIGMDDASIIQLQNFPNIRCFKYVNHEYIPKILQKATYAIHTISTDYKVSHYSSPLKLFEYLSAGLTIFAPNFGSIGEIITDQENGFLYNNFNCESSANKISEVITKGFKFDKEKIKNYVQQYSWENRSIKIVNFIQKIVEQ